MKSLMIAILTLISIPGWALTNNEINDLVVSMATFSEKEKLTEKDLPEITKQLKNILILEKADESHEGPFELQLSYPANKPLYQKAIKSFTPDDQKKLQSILKIVEHIGRDGNG